MREPVIARLLPPLDEVPDVSWPQLQEGARLHLHQRLLHRVANDWHPSERRTLMMIRSSPTHLAPL